MNYIARIMSFCLIFYGCNPSRHLAYSNYDTEILNWIIEVNTLKQSGEYVILPIEQASKIRYEICVNSGTFHELNGKNGISREKSQKLLIKGIQGVYLKKLDHFHEFKIDTKLYKKINNKSIEEILSEISSSDFKSNKRIKIRHDISIDSLRVLMKRLIKEQFRITTGSFGGGDIVSDLTDNMRIRISKGLISAKELKKRRKKIKLSYSDYDKNKLDKVIHFANCEFDYIVLPVLDSLNRKIEISINSQHFRDLGLKSGMNELICRDLIRKGIYGKYLKDIHVDFDEMKVNRNTYILNYQDKKWENVLNDISPYLSTDDSLGQNTLVFNDYVYYEHFGTLTKYLVEQNFRITRNPDKGIDIIYDLTQTNRISEWRKKYLK